MSDRRAQGRALRKQIPRSGHGEWRAAADRADPVAVLEAQNERRLQQLVPLRHGRMMVSPFTFYRGGAAIMAADLATTPTTRLSVQLCGDAHLSNFGFYGSPERALVFDCNDFDETLPGPWEWDLKRLAASVTVASRQNGFDADASRRTTRRCAKSYRSAMRRYVEMGFMDLWYSDIRAEQIGSLLTDSADKKRFKKRTAKARAKGSLHALDRLAEHVDGRYRISSDPPLLVPFRDLAQEWGPDEMQRTIHESYESYLATIRPDRAQLLRRFRIVDAALKVVGVGSVGTRCFILLLQGRDDEDPLFLQIKEAVASVLEANVPGGDGRIGDQPHGQRVVEGQRLMQATSDIFLGWAGGRADKQFYWRQLKDMKGSAEIEQFTPRVMSAYAELCGATLARAHARSGDPAMIAGYLGSGKVFDDALAAFGHAYADQNESDYQEFLAAIDSGRLEATADT